MTPPALFDRPRTAERRGRRGFAEENFAFLSLATLGAHPASRHSRLENLLRPLRFFCVLCVRLFGGFERRILLQTLP